MRESVREGECEGERESRRRDVVNPNDLGLYNTIVVHKSKDKQVRFCDRKHHMCQLCNKVY